MEKEEKGYFTIDEAAEYLNLSPHVVKNRFPQREDEILAAALIRQSLR